ncbi:glycosyltransferase family 2 protein [Aequorivita xiaoshiensis]|uniref:Glycosyltransferase family 2 protein n=1 Tax=Aequorivita xiaoshiensis TaxID=2874476 RepID=A0A9X1U785_9FLAO|nr:glycosyltransferase family 2 protein [Aequorivita xiaoshiensis]MCG2431952.1 glycosyltransferase family 2 protein [Aequorivita xiaoshiensis]
MISILIPTFNCNIFPLVNTLYLQCEKSNIDFEILVMDDASTDKQYLQENLKINLLRNCKFQTLEKNIGRSAIRNLLAQNAVAESLLFLDADVMPLRPDFIDEYISKLNLDAEIICGGITYDGVKPKKNENLRYIYGVNREQKSVSKRQNESHFIVSANILILKKCFLEINTMLDNLYGDDLVLSSNIKKKQIKVIHIDNPVIHYGLEDNGKFIKKALQAVETIVTLEKKAFLENDIMPIQNAFIKLKKYHLLKSFSFIVSRFRKTMERNFNSENPNLFWFDLYRLNYYIQLKKEQNA